MFKVNGKVLIPGVLFFILFVLIGCEQQEIDELSKNITNISLGDMIGNLDFNYKTTGCVNGNQNIKSSGGTEKEPKLEILGSRVLYSREISHDCCLNVTFEEKIDGLTINIYELWSGESCKCVCYSQIEATIDHLLPGFYIVNVFESKKNVTKTLISQEVLIGNNN